MTLEQALESSSITAARGYDQSGQCVVSLAKYGGHLMWLKGFGGNWAKSWEIINPEEQSLLDDLSFSPFGPKDQDEIDDEIATALHEIHDDTSDDSHGPEDTWRQSAQ